MIDTLTSLEFWFGVTAALAFPNEMKQILRERLVGRQMTDETDEDTR